MTDKQALSGAAIKSIVDYLVTMEGMLDAQLMTCKGDPGHYVAFSRSKFFRGYVLGHFEGALQWKGIKVLDDEGTLLQCLALVHARLLGCEYSLAQHYLVESLELQTDSEFSTARSLGGTECFDCLDGKLRMALGLAEHFHQAVRSSPTFDSASPVGSQRLGKAFSDSDVQLLERFADLVARTSGHESFVDFRDIQEGAQACAIGVQTQGRKLMLGSMVATRSPEGFECSVSNFQNERLPGLPEYYSSVEDALAAHRQYFLTMVQSLQERKKPWWKKIFS
jgi:hypothetical protein